VLQAIQEDTEVTKINEKPIDPPIQTQEKLTQNSKSTTNKSPMKKLQIAIEIPDADDLDSSDNKQQKDNKDDEKSNNSE